MVSSVSRRRQVASCQMKRKWKPRKHSRQLFRFSPLARMRGQVEQYRSAVIIIQRLKLVNHDIRTPG